MRRYMREQNERYPLETSCVVNLDRMFLTDQKTTVAERMSTRLVKCASILETGGFIGWQMIVPCKGLNEVSLFGSKAISVGDLEWISEKVGKIVKTERV